MAQERPPTSSIHIAFVILPAHPRRCCKCRPAITRLAEQRAYFPVHVVDQMFARSSSSKRLNGTRELPHSLRTESKCRHSCDTLASDDSERERGTLFIWRKVNGCNNP